MFIEVTCTFLSDLQEIGDKVKLLLAQIFLIFVFLDSRLSRYVTTCVDLSVNFYVLQHLLLIRAKLSYRVLPSAYDLIDISFFLIQQFLHILFHKINSLHRLFFQLCIKIILHLALRNQISSFLFLFSFVDIIM